MKQFLKKHPLTLILVLVIVGITAMLTNQLNNYQNKYEELDKIYTDLEKDYAELMFNNLDLSNTITKNEDKIKNNEVYISFLDKQLIEYKKRIEESLEKNVGLSQMLNILSENVYDLMIMGNGMIIDPQLDKELVTVLLLHFQAIEIDDYVSYSDTILISEGGVSIDMSNYYNLYVKSDLSIKEIHISEKESTDNSLYLDIKFYNGSSQEVLVNYVIRDGWKVETYN